MVKEAAVGDISRGSPTRLLRSGVRGLVQGLKQICRCNSLVLSRLQHTTTDRCCDRSQDARCLQLDHKSLACKTFVFYDRQTRHWKLESRSYEEFDAGLQAHSLKRHATCRLGYTSVTSLSDNRGLLETHLRGGRRCRLLTMVSCEVIENLGLAEADDTSESHLLSYRFVSHEVESDLLLRGRHHLVRTDSFYLSK